MQRRATHSSGYDGNENLASVTDPRGLGTGYAYNGFGDQVQLVSPDTGTTNRTFDEAGNVRTSVDARGVTGTYGYDALNRLTSISYPDQTLNFIYDSGVKRCGASHGRIRCYALDGMVLRRAGSRRGR